MKTSILEQNEIGMGVVELVQRLVDMISWPARRQAMADVTNTLLNGKTRVAFTPKQMPAATPNIEYSTTAGSRTKHTPERDASG